MVPLNHRQTEIGTKMSGGKGLGLNPVLHKVVLNLDNQECVFLKFICKLIRESEMRFPMGIKVKVLARLVHKSQYNLEIAGNIWKTIHFIKS